MLVNPLQDRDWSDLGLEGSKLIFERYCQVRVRETGCERVIFKIVECAFLVSALLHVEGNAFLSDIISADNLHQADKRLHVARSDDLDVLRGSRSHGLRSRYRAPSWRSLRKTKAE